MVLPVLASDLGLRAGNSKLRYRAVTFTSDQNPVVDRSATLTYDVAKPGVRFSGGISGLPAFFDVPGSAIPVAYNKGNLRSNGSLGVLLLHHHNLSGKHAEVVRAPTFIALPIIRRP
jgi:hypothetical protein